MNEHLGRPRWRKSRYCDANNCVEVAWHGGGVAVRDNAVPEVEINVDPGSWRDLLRDLRTGQVGR